MLNLAAFCFSSLLFGHDCQTAGGESIKLDSAKLETALSVNSGVDLITR